MENLEVTIGLAQLAVLLIAGVIAGFVNTLAGGGSLLTLPALIFLGLPSPIANGTNRVAVLLQNTTSISRFHRAGQLNLRDALIAAVPGMLGSVVGALIAVELSEEVFDIALGIVIIVVLITMFLPKPSADSAGSGEVPAWVRLPAFFAIGIYSGFIQAGVGFLLISMITVVFRADLVRTNAIKVTVVGAMTIVSLVIFVLNDAVLWSAGLIIAVGASAGAWLGVRFAVKRGAGAVRWIVVIAASASALRLFGVL